MTLIKPHPTVGIILTSLLLAGCNLTAGDKDRIDDAEDNLQKIALDPKILQPSDQETVSGLVTVLVDVDDSVDYEKVVLQIGATVVEEDFEAPFTFELDTYFLAGQEKVTLLAKAYMVDGNQLRSEVVNVVVDASAANSLGIFSPLQGEAFDKTETVTVTWNEVKSAVSYQYQYDDAQPVDLVETSIEIPFDEIKKHSVKVRAKNELGDYGVWSEEVDFATGLFALAIDIKRYSGYSSYDRNDSPVDFLITDDDFVVLAAGSDEYSDGSGDSYNAYLTEISHDGDVSWKKSYAAYTSPKSLAPTTNGYLITAQPSSWNSSAVFESDFYGNLRWSHLKTGVARQGSDPYSYERIGFAAELSEGEVILSRELREYEQYKDDPSDSYWRSRLTNSQLSFEQINQDTNNITETVITQPAGGEYSAVNNFIITEDDLLAVGKFKSDSGGNDGSSDSYYGISPSGSGAVIFALDKANGILDADATVTGGGLANGSIKDVVELSDGSLLVGFSDYSRSGATVFGIDLTSNDFSDALGITYGRVAGHASKREYMFAGGTSSNYMHSELLIFPEGGGTQRIPLYGFSYDLIVKAIKFDERFGYVILATDKGAMNFSNGSYTVLFNVSAENEFVTPTEFISP